jgi:predicted lactoylglutathione lyase
MDQVSMAVDDLKSAKGFFTELGMEDECRLACLHGRANIFAAVAHFPG